MFPYQTISEFFEAEGDFQENLEAAAEDEQAHWEQDPEYRSLYFDPAQERDFEEEKYWSRFRDE